MKNTAQTFVNSKYADFLSMMLLIIILPLGLFFGSRSLDQTFSLFILILFSVPTIAALIKGAPFVPTPMVRVEKMVAMAKIKKNEVVMDLGCGDGRFVYLAANQYGAKAIGFELSPLVYFWALIRKMIWKSKAKIVFANLKKENLSTADHVFCYLMPEILTELSEKFADELKPGCKVYSYAFTIPKLKLIKKTAPDSQSGLGPIWIYQKV